MGHMTSQASGCREILREWRSALAVVSLLVVGGCGVTDLCACTPLDISSHVIVQGTTMEADGSPASGTALAPLGELLIRCASGNTPYIAQPPVALSDATGFFQLRLVTGSGAGLFCLDLTATHPGNIQVDTLRNVEADFRPSGRPGHGCVSSSTTGRRHILSVRSRASRRHGINNPAAAE